MGTDSKIEWCNHTLNFWIGCTKVSAACDNCYMYRAAKRYGFDPSVVKRTSNATWRQPLAKARATGELKWKPGSKVFVCSWSDFFHEDVEDWWQSAAIGQIMTRPDLIWMILTKRPDRALDVFNNSIPKVTRERIPNLYLGVTVENNDQIGRIDELLKLRDYAKVLFVSAEPALGELDLKPYLPNNYADGTPVFPNKPRLDWVIAGGESGPGARPSHPDWIRKIRDDCAAAGTAFFFKQWGAWKPVPTIGDDPHPDGWGCMALPDGTITDTNWNGGAGPHLIGAQPLLRCSKKKAGNLLDGVKHGEWPEQLRRMKATHSP